MNRRFPFLARSINTVLCTAVAAVPSTHTKPQGNKTQQHTHSLCFFLSLTHTHARLSNWGHCLVVGLFVCLSSQCHAETLRRRRSACSNCLHAKVSCCHLCANWRNGTFRPVRASTSCSGKTGAFLARARTHTHARTPTHTHIHTHTHTRTTTPAARVVFSLATKLLTATLKTYGQGFLKRILQPLIVRMLESPDVSYEINPRMVRWRERVEKRWEGGEEAVRGRECV